MLRHTLKTIRDEPYINFCTQCVIMTLVGGEGEGYQ